MFKATSAWRMKQILTIIIHSWLAAAYISQHISTKNQLSLHIISCSRLLFLDLAELRIKVDLRIKANLLIRPPRYYGRFILT